MSKRTIEVQGKNISILEIKDSDFVSLTDIAKSFNEDNPSSLLMNWLRNKDVIEYLGLWEHLYNPDFNPIEFDKIKNEAGSNRFILSLKRWIENTNAKGIISKPGRYGGTFAHKDIAIGFAYWLNPAFQLYLIKEFQRLKELEQKEQLLNHDWDISRLMTKANFHILTDKIREKLMPPDVKEIRRGSSAFANEVDLINLALFGMTAAEWRKNNPDLEGNIRDHASVEQLIVLSNLQSLDAKLIQWECDDTQRLHILNEAAKAEMEVLFRLQDKGAIEKLKEKDLRNLKLK